MKNFKFWGVLEWENHPARTYGFEVINQNDIPEGVFSWRDLANCGPHDNLRWPVWFKTKKQAKKFIQKETKLWDKYYSTFD